MTRQTEIPGTESKISTKLRNLGETHANAIKAHTRAGVKMRDTKLAVIAQIKEEGVKRYRNTEIPPPIDIELSTEDKLVVKKYRAPEPDEE